MMVRDKIITASASHLPKHNPRTRKDVVLPFSKPVIGEYGRELSDVFLPAGTGSQVLLGQRTIAGETVLGELGVDPQRAGASQ